MRFIGYHAAEQLVSASRRIRVTAPIEKVTAFVTRTVNGRRELLLFEHPYAGIQIPAGTVEPGEAPEAAAIRETQEETGLRDVAIDQYLGMQEVMLPDTRRMLLQSTRVYARPDRMSFNWIELTRGLTVTVERQSGDFTQISYQEWDRQTEPAYVSYQITGWVPTAMLSQGHRRHFFTLTTTDTTPERWEHTAEQVLRFTLFWMPQDALPSLRSSQAAWLSMLVPSG
jgi:8-oxo-dGTP pyrophosphatase MutT (NUDIX family)